MEEPSPKPKTVPRLDRTVSPVRIVGPCAISRTGVHPLHTPLECPKALVR